MLCLCAIIYSESEGNEMKKYWIKNDGRTNTTYAPCEDAWMIANGWREITKAEYKKAADEILRRWAKAQKVG